MLGSKSKPQIVETANTKPVNNKGRLYYFPRSIDFLQDFLPNSFLWDKFFLGKQLSCKQNEKCIYAGALTLWGHLLMEAKGLFS